MSGRRCRSRGERRSLPRARSVPAGAPRRSERGGRADAPDDGGEPARSERRGCCRLPSRRARDTAMRSRRRRREGIGLRSFWQHPGGVVVVGWHLAGDASARDREPNAADERWVDEVFNGHLECGGDSEKPLEEWREMPAGRIRVDEPAWNPRKIRKLVTGKAQVAVEGALALDEENGLLISCGHTAPLT